MGIHHSFHETKDLKRPHYLHSKLQNDTFGCTTTHTDKNFYLFGGFENEFSSLELKMKTFSEGKLQSEYYEYNDYNLPPNLFFHSAAYITPQNGKRMIYLFGGIELATFNISDLVYIFDTTRNLLVKDSQKMFAPLFGHTTEYLNNEICIIGGCQLKNDGLSTIHSFSLWKSSKKLKVDSNIPDPRCYHTSAVIQDKLFVHGGMKIVKGKEKVLDDLWKFSFDLGWQKIDVSPKLSKRFGHFLYMDGLITMFFGGENETNHLVPKDILSFKELISCKTVKIETTKNILQNQIHVLHNSTIKKMIFRKYTIHNLTIFSFGGINYSKFRVLQDFFTSFYSQNAKFPLQTLKYLTNTSNYSFISDFHSVEDFFTTLVHYNDFLSLNSNTKKSKDTIENNLTNLNSKIKDLSHLNITDLMKTNLNTQSVTIKELHNLLEDPYQNQNNIDVFLSAYLVELSSKDLLIFLIDQLKVLSSTMNEKNWKKKMEKVENIADFFKNWMKHFFEDFTDDMIFLMYHFFKDQKCFERIFDQILNLLEYSLKKLKIEELENTYSSMSQKSPKILLSSPKIESLESDKYFENLAKEITILDLSIMSSLKRRDLFSFLNTKSESLLRYEEFMIDLKSKFVMIISNEEKSKRKRLIKKLFDVTLELFHRHNYNSVIIFYEVLNHPIFQELGIEKPNDINKKLSEMKSFIGEIIKKELNGINFSCIPPL